MDMGAYITNSRDRLGYKSFSDMAKTIGVSPDFLLRLAKVTSKEDLKQVNIENLEKVARFYKLTIDQLINIQISSLDNDDYPINYIKDCSDVGIILNELKQKMKEENIKIDNINMNEKSKQIFIDCIDILRDLVKTKL